MQQREFNGLVRVSKATARRLFNGGFEVTIAPCNARIDSPWGLACTVIKGNTGYERLFDVIVNEHDYYNCNAELGKYSAFYVPSSCLHKVA